MRKRKAKNKPRDDREEDTEEMIEWRSMSQEEMDECCVRSRSPQHGEEERRSWRKKKRMSGCWTDVKQRGKNGQCIGNATKACNI